MRGLLHQQPFRSLIRSGWISPNLDEAAWGYEAVEMNKRAAIENHRKTSVLCFYSFTHLCTIGVTTFAGRGSMKTMQHLPIGPIERFNYFDFCRNEKFNVKAT